MGYQAAKLLLDMLENKEGSHDIILDTQLVERESTGILMNITK